VDVIAWNGTSASWLGFDRDERLCERILSATGIPACTSVLAFREIFERTGMKRIGLVTPYRGDVQAKIMANWKESGFVCSAERHLDLQDNFSFATVGEETLAGLIGAVASEGCDAVAIVCTNLRGASVAAAMERELGLPIYDSIATTVWKSLGLAGVDGSRLTQWGSLFRDLRPTPWSSGRPPQNDAETAPSTKLSAEARG
jgi:maleate isomerase